MTRPSGWSAVGRISHASTSTPTPTLNQYCIFRRGIIRRMCPITHSADYDAHNLKEKLRIRSICASMPPYMGFRKLINDQTARIP